jgi:hypothetical protein
MATLPYKRHRRGIDLRKYPAYNRRMKRGDYSIPMGTIHRVRDVRERTGVNLWEAFTLIKIIQMIESGEIKITPAVMAGVTDPKLKQYLVETICLSKVRP